MRLPDESWKLEFSRSCRHDLVRQTTDAFAIYSEWLYIIAGLSRFEKSLPLSALKKSRADTNPLLYVEAMVYWRAGRMVQILAIQYMGVCYQRK